MRCNYRKTVSIHSELTSVNPDIPVLSLPGNDCVAVQDFLATPDNDIFYIITKPEVAANAVYAHRCCVKFFDVF